MIKNLIYGDQVQSGTSADISRSIIRTDGEKLFIVPHDMSGTGEPSKLDILFYNQVNRYGEVLSTIVYLSDTKDADDTSEFVYDPNYTHNNSSLETDKLTITNETNFTWCNASLTNSDLNVLNRNNRNSTHSYSRFTVAADFASKVQDDVYALDGWYSFMSVTPKYRTSAADRGILRRNISDVIEYYNGNDTWLDIWNIDSEAAIADIELRDDNPYVKQDFLVLVKTNTLYNKLLYKDINQEWFTGVQKLKPKLRSLYENKYRDDFAGSQYLIKSLNLTLSYVTI